MLYPLSYVRVDFYGTWEAGNRELGIGSWELGIGSWEVGPVGRVRQI